MTRPPMPGSEARGRLRMLAEDLSVIARLEMALRATPSRHRHATLATIRPADWLASLHRGAGRFSPRLGPQPG